MNCGGRVNVTLSIDDEVIEQARGRDQAMGTSVDRRIRDFLHEYAGKPDLAAANEFERLSRAAWRFPPLEV